MMTSFRMLLVSSVLFSGVVQGAMGSSPVKVSSFGFDPEDSTRFLQAAFNSDAPVIIVDKMPSPWMTGPLKGFSCKRVLFEDGVEVVAKKGSFLGAGECLINFVCCSNVMLSGRAALRMRKADYTKPPYSKSEHRHALNFYGCRNVTIEGLSILDSGGDGIYIGDGSGPCRNFVLRDVVCSGNHRQAISVISVDGLLAERCIFKDTAGTPPAAGIDFEPNRSGQYLAGIVLRNCQMLNNAGIGIEFHMATLNAKSPPVSAVIEGCTMRGNAGATSIFCGSPEIGEVRGSIAFSNCDFDAGDRGNPFILNKKLEESVDLSFKGCRWREKGGKDLLPLTDADWRRFVAHPVFIGGTSQILDVKTVLAKARPIDTNPGEFMRFTPISTRYEANYVIYADSARKVRLAIRSGRIAGKFDAPTGDVVVHNIRGKEVARFPLPGSAVEEVTFEVPSSGFYKVKARLGVGGMAAISGSDVPIAIDADARAALFKPICKLYFEVQDAEVPAAIRLAGGGQSENVAVRIVSPSGAVFWETTKGAGTLHRIMLPRGRETGLWNVKLGKASEGFFEDASFSLVGLPGSLFPLREKRWTWTEEGGVPAK